MYGCALNAIRKGGYMRILLTLIFLSTALMPNVTEAWDYPWKHSSIEIKAGTGKVAIEGVTDYQNFRVVLSFQGKRTALTLTSEAPTGPASNYILEILPDGSFKIPNVYESSWHMTAWWTADAYVIEVPPGFEFTPRVLSNLGRIDDMVLDWSGGHYPPGAVLPEGKPKYLMPLKIIGKKHFVASRRAVIVADSKQVARDLQAALAQITLKNPPIYAGSSCLKWVSAVGTGS